MTGFYDNPNSRKELLKHMILQLHKGEAPDVVRKRLVELLQNIPYDEVVEVEQELINEGLPADEVMKFCDIHTMVLDGHIDTSQAKTFEEGHPVDTFLKENVELLKVVDQLDLMFNKAGNLAGQDIKSYILELRKHFNSLADVDKHYRRKENLLFPFLEKYEITGPPTVMWGKHDEVRQMLKSCQEALTAEGEISLDEIISLIELVLKPTVQAIGDMTMKEEQILFPMTLDKLTEDEWYHIYRQTPEIGYCLYDPTTDWQPSGIEHKEDVQISGDNIQLPTGALSISELTAIFNTMPIDVTFVDHKDKVKYFSLGKHRIFDRNRAIIGRDVRMCHPPGSVHIVEKILDDFKSGKENSSAFWINFKGRFIYIEYFAIRDKNGDYLGTLEFTQDLTDVRKLEGEQRLLSYTDKFKI
jgi:uncharacterized protein